MLASNDKIRKGSKTGMDYEVVKIEEKKVEGIEI